jgi:hypothetical protein
MARCRVPSRILTSHDGVTGKMDVEVEIVCVSVFVCLCVCGVDRGREIINKQACTHV